MVRPRRLDARRVLGIGPRASLGEAGEVTVSLTPADRAATWNAVFERTVAGHRSWDGAVLAWSRELLERADPDRASVVDVGSGESVLVDSLIADGWQRITLLDVSAVALARVKDRLALVERADGVRQVRNAVDFVVSDVLAWQPVDVYTAWFDRAVLHFLTDPADREAYVAVASRALRPGAGLVLGGFAPDGPETCSGLPVARRTAEELAAEFAPHFTLEESWRHVHATPSGAEQVFTWVLLRRG